MHTCVHGFVIAGIAEMAFHTVYVGGAIVITCAVMLPGGRSTDRVCLNSNLPSLQVPDVGTGVAPLGQQWAVP